MVGGSRRVFRYNDLSPITYHLSPNLVELSGIEPPTYGLQSRRSPS